MQWNVPKGTQHVAYEFVPTGKDNNSDNIIQQKDFGKGNNATLITGNTDSPTTTLLMQLTDPQLESAGTYYYYLYSTEQLADNQMNWQFTYSIPEPVVSLASDLPSGLYTAPTIGVDISHQNGPGLASQTTVTLYADTDNQGYDGFKVNSFTPNSDNATYQQLLWNLTNLPLGNYYVYASIDDGINPIVYSAYSTQTNFRPTGPISGYVQDNVNGNVGVAGVQMYLDTNGDGTFDPSTEPSWTTNGDGYYRFDYEDLTHTTPLVSGKTYQVGLVQVEGITLVGNGNRTTRAITVPDVLGADTTFQLNINSSISGTVFQDANQNGTLDSGEQGAGGWTVYVDLNNNGQLDITDPSAVTTSDGAYRIFNLDPNTTYTLRLYQDPDSQSDFFTTSPTSLTVTTGPQKYQLVSGKNFGVLQYAAISGTVNNYNLQPDGSLSGDASPPPGGWDVQLLDQSGNVVATSTADTSTGSYNFGNIKPGNYTIHQVVPSGWLQVSPVEPGNLAFIPEPHATDYAAIAAVAADFNLDGNIDIATLAASSKGGTVEFFLNDGRGNFTKSITKTVSFSSGEAYGMEVIAGLPSNSGPSLAVISKGGWVSVLTNTTPSGGKLSFTDDDNYAHFLHADTMHGVAAGDFNEDGVTDLAGSYHATSGNDNRFSIILMKDATRVDGKHFDNPGGIAVADINGDGHLDLVLNSGNGNHVFNVAYGDETGDFTSDVTTWNLNGGLSNLNLTNGGLVVISDVNSDGIPNVILGTGGDFGMVIQTQNSLGGFFFFSATAADVVGLSADRIQGAEFPNPIVLSSSSIDILALDFYAGVPYSLATLSDPSTPTSLLTADVNSDGLPDIIVTDPGKDGFSVYLNTTQRTTDISVNLSPGQLAGDQDFANDQSAQITGVVFDDSNLNGTQDSFEHGLPDVRVFIDSNRNGTWDPGEPYTFTNSQGAYSFNGLPHKKYVVSIELPEGRILTSLLDGSNKITIHNVRSGNSAPRC